MTPEFAEAFVKMQSELPTVPKSKAGQEGKQHYKYADLASIMEAASPIMAANGFALIHKPLVFQEDGVTMAGVQVDLIHKSGHVESASFAMPAVKEYGTLAKTIGGIITYCRRYSMAILGICTEEDTEPGDGGGSPAVRSAGKKQPPKTRKAPAMSAESRGKIKYAADERIKELGDDSIAQKELIEAVAHGLGYASPIEILEADFGSALEAVQKWEPGS